MEVDIDKMINKAFGATLFQMGGGYHGDAWFQHWEILIVHHCGRFVGHSYVDLLPAKIQHLVHFCAVMLQ